MPMVSFTVVNSRCWYSVHSYSCIFACEAYNNHNVLLHYRRIELLPFARLLAVVVVLCLAPAALLAQDDCPAIVDTALAAVDASCHGVERNQACYGNVSIQAQVRPGVSAVSFEAIGDRVNLSDIESLTLKEMNVATGEWGVALMRVQANLPDTLPGQNVTILLFGDVEITDAPGSASPMQSFYFQSGVGESPCTEAPQNGMLIQTPEGATEIRMNINGVDMQIGSTAFIQAFAPDEDEDVDEGQLIVNLLEGEATISVEEEMVTIPAGQFSTVALDDDLEPTSAPTEPEAYDAEAFSALPLNVLDEEIEIASMDDEEPGAVGDVAPLSGSWLYTTGELEFSDGCPPELVSYMPTVMPPVSETSIIDWTGGFTAENYIRQIEVGGEPLPAGASVSSPEPGVIQMEYAEEGASIIIEARLITERMIETTMAMTITEGMNCTIIIPGVVEFQD